jgi:acid phosphatase (class A)
MARHLRTSLLGLLLTAALATAAAETELHYLPPDQPDGSVLLAPPPLAGSAEEAADMAAVVSVRRARTQEKAAQAAAEKKLSWRSFGAAVGAGLLEGRLPKTEAFLAQVQADAEGATGRAKEYWKRPRPYTANPKLASGKMEKTYSYPSSHSTDATVLALVLGELFPAKREELLAMSRDLGWHRVIIARHYPTDIYAGRVFGQAIVREMKANPAFQRDLAEVKKEIAAQP